MTSAGGLRGGLAAEEVLGEAIAQRLNSEPAQTNGAGGSAVTRADDMSVDEIVHSLLADPHAAAMLSHLSCPPVASASGGVSAQMARSNPSTPGRQPALVEPNAAAPSSRLPARSRAQPGVISAAFPARVDIDSFLNRLHAGGEHGGEMKE